ncbi:MAG: PhzF family phenazine biosynthesis protein [Proteobacteria bacterium]|nr:PhzF family phenazine biosynthesis protein [Pseudomonadota bacterium]
MPTINVRIINAFGTAGGGGNPAGVVLDADDLSGDTKQEIARRVGLSETAFVSTSTCADFKLDFYTPTQQIAHCGHATIAVFSYLASQGKIQGYRSSKETVDGVRKIVLSGDMAFMEQKAPRYIDPKDADVDLAAIVKSVGLEVSDLIGSVSPVVVNTGNSFLLIPVASEDRLSAAIPDLSMIAQISDRLDLIGYYAFTTETRQPSSDAAGRMFAPRYGIPEESATGMAAGPLACFLYDKMGVKKTEIVIEQGYLMVPPSPSVLFAHLSVEGDIIGTLVVGGSSAVSKTISIALD